VIKLLNDAPQWSGRDLADLSLRTPLQLYAARAFASNPTTKEKALALVHAYLGKHSGDDKGYILLLDLEGENALPFLEKLAASDRWEERPLIWKAELLRRTGHLHDAEKAARSALAIDPTDGEEPQGDRVRGYAVLANTLDSQGRQNDAKIFHRVVESVRIAEEGDALKQAGLMHDALAKYETAETSFADAYCIQWRLAERLMQEGHVAEAEKHYEAAFTRMPEQFGRMAHLCFGCENIFGNPTGRSAADRILSRLAAMPKPQPQALLILARLRIQQDRPSEAYALLQRAVAVDNDYMDAWKELQSLTEKVDAPLAERQRIVQRLLDLDPSNSHNGVDGESLFILGPEFLWARLQAALEQRTPEQGLFPLTAAIKRQETEKSSSLSSLQQKNQRQYLLGEYDRNNRWREKGWDFVQMLGSICSPVNSGSY
jgi:tetratricopeptide (TPR) repeat protein